MIYGVGMVLYGHGFLDLMKQISMLLILPKEFQVVIIYHQLGRNQLVGVENIIHFGYLEERMTMVRFI